MQKRKISFRHRVEYLFFIAFVYGIKISPLFLINFSKRALRYLFGKLSKRHPGIVAKNLKIAYPGQSEEERTTLTERIYRHFSTVFVDIIYLFVKKKPEKILKPIEIIHLDYLEKALEKKRGVILFSGHFGNWELVPYILSRKLNVTLNSIARKMDNSLVEKKVLAFREFMGSVVIDKKNALRTMLKRLEDNGIVYLLIDQNTIEREAVFVQYFGETVSAVPSVSLLHMKRDIPVIPLFLHYEEDKIVMEFQPELDATDVCKQIDKSKEGGNKSECIRQLTQWSTTIIEEKVKQHPEQWLWFHNRWKTKPSTHQPLEPAMEQQIDSTG
jgi:Kdo2-lipid IVA lauroyltransferase/acyltransferase